MSEINQQLLNTQVMSKTYTYIQFIYNVVTAEIQYFPFCECKDGNKCLIAEICSVNIAKPYCTIMNTALMEALRHTVGLVTEQLC